MWEMAALEGGPANGLRVSVADRPLVLQVTVPCTPEDPAGELRGEADDLRVEMVYVYRRRHAQPPLRYGFDPASP
ncbi:hypothetical protein FCI23_42540 [Actinacidiphila oryziradicis]|uniref:Uncharacterized protein n=2 Tax=Actinacidiphila oryziradicis TaxID=2571141 RepID=A0A4U0RYE3_9ACTN|nr:hypothetical protein FCI23_42540 [Actinacidiphila oryziradicis]